MYLLRSAAVLAALLTSAGGCSLAARARPCEPVDAVLARSSFVVVVDPAPGARVASPFRVRGCSRTFESNVVWELRARDGRTLAAGHATGGGASGAAAFDFRVAFAVDAPELGHLAVFAPDVSDGEGFPGGRNVLPLVLLPASPEWPEEGSVERAAGVELPAQTR